MCTSAISQFRSGGHFTWRRWTLWSSNPAMGMGKYPSENVSAAVTPTCSLTHPFSRAGPAPIHQPCSGSWAGDDLWWGGHPTEILPDRLPKLIWQSSGPLWALPVDPCDIWSLKTGHSTWAKASSMWEHGLPQVAIIQCFTYDTFPSLSVLWPTTASDTVLRNCCRAKKGCDCAVDFCYSSTLTYLSWLNLLLFFRQFF